MKKLINDPNDVARETIEGLVLAYSQYLKQVEGLQVVARRDAPVAGQVSILTGGGSGHEPMFAGFVGRGMAHGSVAGNIFASPPPAPILAAAKAIHSGRGVLFLYGNYSGDVLNFDAAAELLEMEDIPVKTVRITDDVASAPPGREEERRGIAGDLFVIKAAGARAEEGADLAGVTTAAEEANANTRTMAIALSSCTIPASGKPIFEISEADMEIGMGLHGEPGIRRGPMMSAEQVGAQLVEGILADLPALRGAEVAVMVNGMGATPLAELLIVYRAVHRVLAGASVSIVRAYTGNFATSLEMAGCSITLMRLTPLLKRLMLAPAESPAFVQV
ncbi:MAG TPA: dihydroxyacetone kinase subunit DhaK [Bryobacteraceae bacterium]|nr:dihydroxyacetone kinase subunit DhaK [Bryobacteraceae bacterium]